MKRITRIMSVMAIILLTGNLLMAQSAKVDFDKTIDFTKFKTFKYIGWEQNSDKILNDLDKKRIEEAFRSELVKRGMTIVDANPSMAVSLFIITEQKTSTTAHTNYTGGMGYGGGWGYGYGRGYGVGVGVGMGSSTTTYSESDYEVGTLVISFYNEADKKLIWQGTLSGTIKSNPKKRDKRIANGAAKLMSKYPVKPTK